MKVGNVNERIHAREQTCYVLAEGRGKRHGCKTGENARPMQTDKFHRGETEEPKNMKKEKQ